MLQKAFMPQLRLGNLWPKTLRISIFLLLLSPCFFMQAQVVIEVDDINLFSPQTSLFLNQGSNFNQGDIQYFPNPVKDNLQIRSSVGRIDQLTIKDMQGIVKLDVFAPSGQIQTNLSPGFYWVKCKIGNTNYEKMIQVISP